MASTQTPAQAFAKQATSDSAMVAAGHPLAVQAACAMLERGGSAADAAIAADAVMGVVEPMATSIGGDVLAMVYEPGGRVTSYNGTGRAPARLTPDLVADLPGQRIPERHPFSVTTPGAVQGWFDLHARHGRLPLADLLEPAIRHARDGFAVAAVAAREWKLFDHELHVDPNCARLYRAGNSPVAGEILTNPALGALLEAIATHGPQAFYQGAMAHATASAVQTMGGLLAAEDLHAHSGNFCEPVFTDFFGCRVHQCPPNTHGVAILDALEQIAAHGGNPEDPSTWVHLIRSTASAMRRARETVADPSGNTVCSVVVDRDGLAITLMSSIFKRFGSGIVVPEGGFVLQNRGFGFATPGHVNGPAPRKRPYHTVVPGITTRNGEFLLGMGVVGGLMQPQGQIQILTRVLAWNTNIQTAIEAPRMRLEAGDTLAIEAGTPAAIETAMRSAGFAPPAASAGELGGRSDFGGAHAVFRHADGTLQGAADPRKDGAAATPG